MSKDKQTKFSRNIQNNNNENILYLNQWVISKKEENLKYICAYI